MEKILGHDIYDETDRDALGSQVVSKARNKVFQHDGETPKSQRFF